MSLLSLGANSNDTKKSNDLIGEPSSTHGVGSGLSLLLVYFILLLFVVVVVVVTFSTIAVSSDDEEASSSASGYDWYESP
jgi:hypothetical protein